MSAVEPELRKARRMLAIFWVFTVVYLILGVAVIVTRGAAGLIFIAILAYSWIFRGLPDARAQFAVLREARRAQQDSAGT